MLWVDKRHTLKQLHVDVFKHFRPILGEWIDWADPKTARVPTEKYNLKTTLIDFPYQPEEGKQITKAEFMEMDIEKCFDLCFPGIEQEDNNDILQMPYRLIFKDVTGYWDECHFCGE